MAATAGTREISYPNGWEQSFTQMGESKVFRVTGKVYALFSRNGNDAQWAASASRVVQGLFEENSHLVRTFDVQPANAFTEQLLSSTYLAINGLAVCIFDRVVPARVSPMVRDIYFTRAIVCNPVRCNGRGNAPHAVEMDLLVKWMENTGRANCPCGAQISEVEIDGDIQFDCEDVAERMEARDIGGKNECVNVKNRIEQDRLTQVLAREDSRRLEIVAFEARLEIATGKKDLHIYCAAGKIILKGAGTLAAKHIAKVAIKEGVKKGAEKAVAKVIPGVSLVIGVGLGIKRFADGDVGRGVLEIGSGAAACFPGAGTAVSLAADVAIGAIDISEHNGVLAERPNGEVSQAFELNTDSAYEILFGMEKDDCVRELRPDGMKRKVNTLRRALHEDKSRQDNLAAYQRERLAALHQLVEALYSAVKEDLDIDN